MRLRSCGVAEQQPCSPGSEQQPLLDSILHSQKFSQHKRIRKRTTFVKTLLPLVSGCLTDRSTAMVLLDPG